MRDLFVWLVFFEFKASDVHWLKEDHEVKRGKKGHKIIQTTMWPVSM